MSFWDGLKEQLIQEADKQNVKAQERKEVKQEDKQRIKQLKREGVAYCPKCKSTSLQYAERRKRLSIGRGIVGTLIHPVGGVVGALTSKKYKGFIKCLNCGNTWKS